jgi:hypothetical protein
LFNKVKDFMKFIAFYLPQYHIIPENDLWWGKGFTEWIRVREAKPLFEDHYQPRVPYNYYDLSDINVMKMQARLASEYGIHGFCYYHYWFNGKLLLEKPLEQMLVNQDVDIPFCLSWANEKWTRAWEGKSKETLIHQNYGSETEWKDHLDYLIPFFNDNRYIKIDGRPMLLIYRTESFSLFDKMIFFWNTIMKEKGFKELYVIEMLSSYQKVPRCENSQGVVEFEPMLTIGSGNSLRSRIRSSIRKRLPFLYRDSFKIFDYDRVWKKITGRKNTYDNKAVYLGAFTDWDNTPRFKEKAAIFKNVSAKKFQFYLNKQCAKSSSEYLFINAWNEWAEGAYLEPDLNSGTSFLSSVRKVKDGHSG